MQTNFAGGLNTHYVYNPRGPGVSAQYLRNCRVDSNGWLVPRKGRRAAARPTPFSYQDAYGGPPLAKVGVGSVRYSESGSATAIPYKPINLAFQAVKVDTSEVQQVFPSNQGAGDAPPPILAPRTVVGELSDPLKVETVRVVDASDPLGEFERDPGNAAISYRARVTALAVVHKAENQIAVRFNIQGTLNLKISIIDYGSRQIVRVLRNTSYQDGGASDVEPGQRNSQKKEVIWDGRDAYGNLVQPGSYAVEFEERVPIVEQDAKGNDLPVTRYAYRHSWLPFNIAWETIELTVKSVPDATHVDVFATEDLEASRYFWIARVPVNEAVQYHFPIPDINTEAPLTFETDVDWHYIATNDFRAYVAKQNSHRIYISHYNPGTNERLYRNFTDFIDIDLNGGHITGLHFIRDTHLVVYASNQIQILATDPIIELHRIIDFIKPHDDKGEFIGCTAPESIVNMGGIHYFLASNKHVYAFDGTQLRERSDKVQGILQQLVRLANAVGFSYNRHYFLSIGIEGSGTPNTTLVYDVEHNVWWQDDFGVTDAVKDAAGNVYGTIDGVVYQLYTGDTDNGQPIRRIWKGHPFYGRLLQQWHNVHVSPQTPAVIDVTAYTEQERASQQLNIQNVRDIYSQRMGMFLWGRTLAIEIDTRSDAAIDRISVNEEIRL